MENIMDDSKDTTQKFNNFQPELNDRDKGFLADFKRRIAAIRATRWIRFGVVTLLFFLWVIWMGNPWLSLIWLLLIDIYITAYIPWSWWKNRKGWV